MYRLCCVIIAEFSWLQVSGFCFIAFEKLEDRLQGHPSFARRSHVPHLSGSVADFPFTGPSGGTGVEQLVVKVLRRGYCLPFSSLPPLSRVPIPLPSCSPSSIKRIALLGKVSALLLVSTAVCLLYGRPRGHEGP